MLMAAPAFGQESSRVRAARVSATDVPKTAIFYQTVFGLKEVRVVERDGKPYESIMNYGATVEEATASKATKVVIILRAKDAPAPSVSNLIFEVTNMEATIAKAVKAGGSQSRPIAPSTTGPGARYAFIKDPAGNEIELIQP